MKALNRCKVLELRNALRYLIVRGAILALAIDCAVWFADGFVYQTCYFMAGRLLLEKLELPQQPGGANNLDTEPDCVYEPNQLMTLVHQGDLSALVLLANLVEAGYVECVDQRNTAEWLRSLYSTEDAPSEVFHWWISDTAKFGEKCTVPAKGLDSHYIKIRDRSLHLSHLDRISCCVYYFSKYMGSWRFLVMALLAYIASLKLRSILRKS